MFEDDAAAWSESNPQPPSDSIDSRGAADTTRTLQEPSNANPNMNACGAADSVAPSYNASSMSAPVPSTLAVALAPIAGSADASTTAAAASGDMPPAPTGAGNLAALDATSSAANSTMSPASGDAGALAASAAASPDGAAPTAPVIFASDHVDHLGTSADQFAPSPVIAPIKQMLGPIQGTTDSGSGSTGAASTATLGPILGPLDAASAGAPPSNGDTTPVHPDAAVKSKAPDVLSAVVPTIKAATADATSIPSIVESGTKAILLSAHDGTVASGGVVGLPGPKLGAGSAPTIPAPSIAPDVLAARDQLASAIATANPTAAAITTSPTPAAPAPLVPTLGADTHTLHMHGG